METKLIPITVVAAVIAVSGCSALPIPSSGGETTSPEPSMVSGKGLEVTQFSVSDNTVTPGQEVAVTLKLKNYHTEPIEIDKIRLYNLGLLSKKKGSKECTPEEIGQAKDQGVYPVMKCEWTIEAPPADTIGGFDQRKTSIAASIAYESTIKNVEPMKVNFEPLSNVNSTGKKTMTYSNGEVKVNLQTESPVPRGQKKLMQFEVSEVGGGRVKEKKGGDYNFSYSPQNVFQTESESGVKEKNVCPEEDSPVLEDTLKFSCYIGVSRGPQPVVRNLFFTVSYKYVRAPSLDITIVS